MCGCYTCGVVVKCVSTLCFGVLRGALVPCHPCEVRVGVAVFVSPLSEVAQVPLIEYTSLEILWGASAFYGTAFGVGCS